MVSLVSDSKVVMKQGAQRREWFLGRRICAREVWHWAQRWGGIFFGGTEAMVERD